MIGLFILCASVCFLSAVSMDVSWIPSEANGPLPLSENYRSSLRTLCSMLQNGKQLSSELELKRPVLKIMCQRLKEDDGGISSALSTPPSSTISYLVGGATIAYLLYTNYESIAKSFKATLNYSKSFAIANSGSASSSSDTSTMAEKDFIRNQRLKRFDASQS